jgi:hypothetical protein
MSWFRRNWRWAVFGAIAVLGLATGLWFAFVGKDEEIQALKAQLQLKSAVTKVRGLEADRIARRDELLDNKAEAAKLREELQQARKDALELFQDTQGMTDLEIVRAYRKLGY